MKLKILLLSAYDAQSHCYWREGLCAQFSEHEWTVLSLPARYFAWRIRGNSLSWAFKEESRKLLKQHYDLLIATSMTDLSALKGMVPNLASIPSLVYFHENQFAYPETDKAYQSLEPRMLNLYTALSARCIAFNSEYNRQTFLQGCENVLAKLPDEVPDKLVDKLSQRSVVLPVPLLDEHYRPNIEFSGPLQIVWNHRWEYDKGPELLLNAVRQLKLLGVDFTLHVLGQQFRKWPKAFDQLEAELGAHKGEWGFVSEAKVYRRLLQQADVVLSTALHDFQGIAVLEAVAAGCIPVVPARLAYPELFGRELCYAACADDNEAMIIASRLAVLAQSKRDGNLPAPPDIRYLNWRHQRSAYAALITRLAKGDLHSNCTC